MRIPQGFQYAGSVDVDSGTLMIGDPCYVDGGFDYDQWAGQDGVDDVLPGPSDYAPPGKGGTFCAYTAWGDGTYPVYVLREEGRITAMLVDTNPQDDEEDWR